MSFEDENTQPTQDTDLWEKAEVSDDMSQAWGRAVSTNPAFPNFELVQKRVMFGRKSTCDVRLNHGAISKEHCMITREEEDIVFLTDLSTNGTYVDKKKLESTYMLLS